MTDRVPTLDFRQVATSSFAADLARAYEEYGFVVISHHGIPEASISAFLAAYKAFFSLPVEAKRRYHVPGGGGARGYTPFGIETAKGAKHHDLKEFWHMGRELPPGHAYRQYMQDNIWVDEIANFKAANLEMFAAFDRVGRQMLGAISRAIGLPETFFDDKVNDGNSVLRVIHYPPMPAQPTESERAGAHEDINVITLLLGAEEPGLQVKARSGEWLPINPEPGALVCNVGDMLQRLTNTRLRSTTHRVVNPPSERASIARYSMPFFLHFNPDFLIKTLPECITADRPNHFPEPITADGYLQERLSEIKLK
jgi:isopenicillin N synthase-like dioxygenase